MTPAEMTAYLTALGITADPMIVEVDPDTEYDEHDDLPED